MKSRFQPAALTAIQHQKLSILWLFAQSIYHFCKNWRWFLQHTLVVYIPYFLMSRLSRDLIDVAANMMGEVSSQIIAGFLAFLLSNIVPIVLMVIYWPLSVMPIAHWAEQLIEGKVLDYRNALKLGFRQWRVGISAIFKVWLIIAAWGIFLGLAWRAAGQNDKSAGLQEEQSIGHTPVYDGWPLRLRNRYAARKKRASMASMRARVERRSRALTKNWSRGRWSSSPVTGSRSHLL
ncbi:MAG: hypothetical protein AAGG51_23465 [Cyanobacteria bacterium P01_G01_bin.54]